MFDFIIDDPLNIAYFCAALASIALPLLYIFYLAKTTGNYFAWAGLLTLTFSVYSSLSVILGPLFIVAWAISWSIALPIGISYRRGKKKTSRATPKKPEPLQQKKVVRRSAF